MTIAAKHLDMIVGVDTHIIMSPSPAGPIPTPIPHPYVGIVFDPIDYVPIIGATVWINGFPAGTAGSAGMATPPHIPLGGPFMKPPTNESEIFMGSATVLADGEPLSFLGMPVLSCQDIGMPAPPRPKKKSKAKSLMLPTSVVIAIPGGMPVLVGGPPTISMSAMVAAAGMSALKKLGSTRMAKAVSRRTHALAGKVMDKLGVKSQRARDLVHKAVCTVTGHPVDVATGKMFTDAVDFELPGPIPFRWERTWKSTSEYEGPLGHGWHHAYDWSLCVDERHKVVAVRLADGRAAAFRLPVGNEEVFDRMEKLTLFRDARGFAVRTKDGLTYRFSPCAGLGDVQPLTSIANAVGRTIWLRRDDAGRLVRVEDSAGRELVFEYDEHDRLVGIFGPDPRAQARRPKGQKRLTVKLVGYRYDAHGDLVGVSDALGSEARFRYQSHLMVQETDRNGLSFYFEYDAADASARCVRTWGDGGIYHHRLEYDANAPVTRVTDSLGHVTTYVYSSAGVVTEVVDAHGNASTTTYNEWTEKVEEADALGNKTAYEVDERGNTIGVTRPDGSKLALAYDDRDRLVRAVDELGGWWQWRYDSKNRLVSRHLPQGRAVRYEYDEQRLRAVVGPAGERTTVEFDVDDNVKELVAPNGAKTRWVHDLLGRVRRVHDAHGNEQARSVDLLGRVTKVREADGTVRHLEYDREGNVTHVHDQQRDVLLRYSGMGRMIERHEAGTIVKFQYDTEEQLTAIINEHGRVFEFVRDAVGEVVEERGFGGVVRRYDRDAAGSIVAIRRRTGIDSFLRYDPMGRVTSVEHGDGTAESYVYRADGELMTAANEDVVVKYERDRLGRVTREWQGDHWVASRYNDSGDRTHMWSSFGAAQVLTRDASGDVTAVRAQDVSGGEAKTLWESTFQRDLLGRELERALPGGVRSRWQRDRVGRPIKHEVETRHDTTRPNVQFRYTWGINGRLLQFIDTQYGPTRYRHDEFGNLIAASYADNVVDLRMPDAVGNLFRVHDRSDRVYGPGGEILAANGPTGTTRYRYDEEGNRVAKVLPDGKTWVYEWSPGGRLRGVVRPNGERVEFVYDALGRRVRKTYRGVTTHWVWDGDNPLHEWQEGEGVDAADEAPPEDVLPALLGTFDPSHAIRGPPLLEFFDIPEEQYTAAPKNLVTWLFEPGSAAPMTKITGTQRLSVVCDQLGTPIAMYDARGERVWRAAWGINGEVRHLDGARMDCPFRFPGQYEDAETGLYYNRFRYYDPEIGSYVSEDPIGLAGGLAVYGYVKDPSTWTDELGLSGGCGEVAADDALVRRGSSWESTSRLARQADAAKKAGVAQNGVPYGHGVSVTTPAANSRLASDPTDASSATRRAFEDAGFEVRHTPTRKDSTHHTVQLPEPVTPEVAQKFNEVLGRTKS